MDTQAFRDRMNQYKQAKEQNPQLKYWDWKKYEDGGEVKDNTYVAPIYREQTFIPATGATKFLQDYHNKYDQYKGGNLEIVSPEFDILTSVTGLKPIASNAVRNRARMTVYNNIAPGSYKESYITGGSKKTELANALKDFFKPGKIKEAPKWREAFQDPKWWKEFGYSEDAKLAEEIREEAWKRYLGIKHKPNYFVDNYDGTVSYNLNKIPLKHQQNFINSSIRNDRTVTRDFIGTAGGNVSNTHTIGKNGYDYITLEDIWDLNPLQDANRVSLLPKKLLNKMSHIEIQPDGYKKRVYDKWVPDWFKNIEVSNFIGEGPFTNKTIIKAKQLTDWELNSGFTDSSLLKLYGPYVKYSTGGTIGNDEDPPSTWTSEDIDNPVYSKKKPLSIKDQEELLIKSKQLQGLQNLQNIGNYAYDAAGFTPLFGDILSVYDTGKAVANKDWLTAGLAALTIIPFVPNSIGKNIRKYIPTVNRSSVNEQLNRIQGITPNLNRLQKESDWNNLRNRSIERLYDKDVRDRAAKIKAEYDVDLQSTYDQILNQYENAYYTLPEAEITDLSNAKAKMDIQAEANRRYKQYGIKPKQSDFTMKIDNAINPSQEITNHEINHFNQYIHQGKPSWNESDLSKITNQFKDALRDENPLAPDQTTYFKNWMEQNAYGINMLDRLKEQNIIPTKKNILKYLKSLPDTDAIKRAALQFKSLDDYIKWLEVMPLANNISKHKNIEDYNLA